MNDKTVWRNKRIKIEKNFKELYGQQTAYISEVSLHDSTRPKELLKLAPYLLTTEYTTATNLIWLKLTCIGEKGIPYFVLKPFKRTLWDQYNELVGKTVPLEILNKQSTARVTPSSLKGVADIKLNAMPYSI